MFSQGNTHSPSQPAPARSWGLELPQISGLSSVRGGPKLHAGNNLKPQNAGLRKRFHFGTAFPSGHHGESAITSGYPRVVVVVVWRGRQV